MVDAFRFSYPRLGMIGGGQLGKMICQAAKRMGLKTIAIDPSPECPVNGVCDKLIVGDFKDESAIRELAAQSDFLTFEIELANASVLAELEKQGKTVNPSPKALSIIQDKLKQKQYLNKNKIPVADFMPVTSTSDLGKAAELFGFPMVLKAATDSYDGRGNRVISSKADFAPALAAFAGRALYVEKWVDFDKEVSIIAARNASGQIECFPLVENKHEDNILVYTVAPARVSRQVLADADALAKKVLSVFDGGGVFCIELFLTKDGQLLVNEIAPRPHNSGHYTIEACSVSQFEQHVRGVLNLPLAKPRLLSPAAMVNILGDSGQEGTAILKGVREALSIDGVVLHLYGKKSTRPKRKMGHITVLNESQDEALKRGLQARNALRMENEVQ